MGWLHGPRARAWRRRARGGRAPNVPKHEVRMRRALRRQVLGQRLPLATRREHVEDCVENLANIHLAPTAAALGWRDHRLNQRPFGIRQVTRISQTTPLSSAAMFRFPHLGTPQSKIRVPHNESQMILPTQQLSGSALSLGKALVGIFPDCTSVSGHYHAGDSSSLGDVLPNAYRELAHR